MSLATVLCVCSLQVELDIEFPKMVTAEERNFIVEKGAFKV